MSNGTVGVRQGDPADRLIDNDELTVGGQTVQRQRVNVVPVGGSLYKAGTSGSVNIPTTHRIVSVSCYCETAGSLSIAGGDTISIPAGGAFTDDMRDAPIDGIGAGSVVFTSTSSYYVRYVPKVV